MSQSSPFSETALTVEPCFGKAETGGGAALSCPAYLSLRGWRASVGWYGIDSYGASPG